MKSLMSTFLWGRHFKFTGNWDLKRLSRTSCLITDSKDCLYLTGAKVMGRTAVFEKLPLCFLTWFFWRMWSTHRSLHKVGREEFASLQKCSTTQAKGQSGSSQTLANGNWLMYHIWHVRTCCQKPRSVFPLVTQSVSHKRGRLTSVVFFFHHGKEKYPKLCEVSSKYSIFPNSQFVCTP